MDMEIQPVPWWNRRSRMERRLIWLIGSLFLVSLGLIIGLCGVLYKPELFVQLTSDSDDNFDSDSRFEPPAATTSMRNELDPRYANVSHTLQVLKSRSIRCCKFLDFPFSKCRNGSLLTPL